LIFKKILEKTGVSVVVL